MHTCKQGSSGGHNSFLEVLCKKLDVLVHDSTVVCKGIRDIFNIYSPGASAINAVRILQFILSVESSVSLRVTISVHLLRRHW